MKRKLILLSLITVLVSMFLLGNSACTEEYQPGPTCYLAIERQVGGDVYPEENGPWSKGSPVAIMAVPDPGYEFVSWWSYDDDARCAIVQPCAALTTIWMNGDYYIMPRFRPTGQLTCNKGDSCHVIIGKSGGGSITSPGTGAYVYPCGSVIQLEADPDPGYEFFCWTGGDLRAYFDPCAATTSLNMCGNHCITAVFRPADCPSANRYDLTISGTGGGAVTEPGEGTFAYKEGAFVELVTTPHTNYVFDEWTGDIAYIGLLDGTYYIRMLGDCSITANFVPQL
jgi:hypothetical protein